MALIDPAKTDSIREEVTAKYLKDFPEMKGKYGVFICDTADGVSV